MKKPSRNARLWVVSGVFVLLLLVLVWRMVDLTVLNRQFLRAHGNARSLRTIDIPAYRGMITDRNGTPLAVSTPVEAAWVNPKTFNPPESQLASLARLLDIDKRRLSAGLSRAKGREFVYLRRQLPPMLSRKIAKLDVPGVNFLQEFKRYYPDGESAAQVVGFTNVDDNGLEGLELAYQDWLQGVPGKKRVVKDRLGQVIEDLGVIREPKPGHPLTLSIDRRIQYLAHHELQKTVEEFSAKSGSVVVIDTRTGEILAAANAPSFNPNAREHYTRDSYRNKAITDTFEPGSVIKPFSIASALESGLFTPDTIIDTNPGRMMAHGRLIRDIHNYGVLTVTGVLQHSSNIGVSKMVLASPPEQLTELLRRCGFAQRTESGYPGEAEGALAKVTRFNPFVLATISFGYAVSVTPLQLARAYTVFANEGRLKPVTLLHSETEPKGEQVMKPETARQVLMMMEAVLGHEGTGKLARVPGYRVAGKTGTARVARRGGYETNRHIGTFAGIAPVSNPRLVVVVMINQPLQKGYYGGAVAGPLFSRVMAGALRILDVPPDEAPA